MTIYYISQHDNLAPKVTLAASNMVSWLFSSLSTLLPHLHQRLWYNLIIPIATPMNRPQTTAARIGRLLVQGSEF